MLLNLSSFQGYHIAASDGTIGAVSDVFFDDASWTIRWLVVDTGNWLSGRQVLLPPAALGHPDPDARTFPVRLSRAEVEASPELDTHRPVSRQFEVSTYDYYGWSPYWGMGYYPGGYGLMGGAPWFAGDSETRRSVEERVRHQHDNDEPHLRSAGEITGYYIHATDGEIGHLSDLVMEDTDWSIRYMIVDTSNWWLGQKVLISPRAVQKIHWQEQLIDLDVTRQTVRDSPAYDPARRLDREYEDRMAGHYATPQPEPDSDPSYYPQKVE